MADRLAVGIDLGATRMRVCIGDRRGRFLKRYAREMQVQERVEEYVAEIIDGVKAVMVASPGGKLEGIGVASTGPLDTRRGGIAGSPNLPYSFIPISESLRGAFDTEVTLLNDARAAALAEKTYGAGRTEENLVFVTISTGIGGGAIVDGRLLLGKDGNAGEIGHMTVVPSGGMRCGCGRDGHWEAYCSGRHIPDFARLLIANLTRQKFRAHSRSRLVRAPIESSAFVFRLAKRGDKLARLVLEEVGKLNSIGMANLINLYDPSLITVGGGVALNNPELVLGSIRRHVSDHAINRKPRIIITPLGDDVGLLGALSAVFEPKLIGR